MSEAHVTEFAAESHPGNRYQHNEDSLGWVESAGVWLVADGMGGHACGDIASRTVKQSILQSLGEAADSPGQKPLTTLISDAHDAVVAEGVRRSAENMGSTVVVVRLDGNKAQVGWCGDSRVYLWRNQELVRLTRDHSLLEQLLESGVVDQSEAFGHPQKHVLVQALGITNPAPVPAQLEVELTRDDTLLLCSDGLHDELRDEEINELLVANPEPGAAAGALVKRVLEGPARDNVSVVLVRLDSLDVAQQPLSVAQLRERFERLPGRRPSADANAADVNAADAVTPVHSPQAIPASRGMAASQAGPAPRVMAAPKIALPSGSTKKSPALADFDRDLLIALAAVCVLIVLLILAS